MISNINNGANGIAPEFYGLATDTKPSSVNGALFVEMDTGNKFRYDEENNMWCQTEAYVTGIAITSAPTTTSYKEYEHLDLDGIVVTATFSDNTTKVVTSSCTFSPANGAVLTKEDTSVSVTYGRHEATQALTVSALSSIAWSTAPTKVSYTAGEELDLTGGVVTATYANASTKDVTILCDFDPENETVLATTHTKVVATYMSKTAEQAITVTEPVLAGAKRKA